MPWRGPSSTIICNSNTSCGWPRLVHGDTTVEFGPSWAGPRSRSRLGGTAPLVQAPLVLPPGGVVHRPDGVVGVEFQAGQDVDPADDPFHIPFDRGRHDPEPRRLVIAAGQERPAVGAEGQGEDPALVLEPCFDG